MGGTGLWTLAPQLRGMRWLCLLFLTGCAAMADTEGPVNTQEYIFVMANDRAFMRVLPASWQPVYEGGFLRIDKRHRVLAMDIILIQPRMPIEVNGLEMARVFRRAAPSNTVSYDLWVYTDQYLHIGDPSAGDLVPVGPHTWIRPNAFRVELRRPVKDDQ